MVLEFPGGRGQTLAMMADLMPEILDDEVYAVPRCQQMGRFPSDEHVEQVSGYPRKNPEPYTGEVSGYPHKRNCSIVRTESDDLTTSLKSLEQLFKCRKGRAFLEACEILTKERTGNVPQEKLADALLCWLGFMRENKMQLAAELPKYLGSMQALVPVTGSNQEALAHWQAMPNDLQLSPGDAMPEQRGVTDRCPGGEPGTCRQGRDPDSVACFRCMPGLHDSSGTCRHCGVQEYAWVVACMMLCVLGLMALYAVNLAARDVRQAGPGSLLMAALGLGQMVTLVQQLLIIQQFQIDWVEPFRSIMAALQIVAFDLDALRLGCMAPAGSLSNFLFRTFVLPTFCIIAAIIHVLYANFFHTPCWQKRGADVSTPSPKPEMTLLFSTVGTLWLVFFISHGATILAPFRCTEHPSGQLTVQGYEDVICNYGGEHLSMVFIGSINCVLPIGFLAACVWVLCAELPKRIMIADMKFVRACAFLLLRFRPGQGTVTALYLVRNVLILMCPLVPTAAGKVLSMNLLLYVSLLLTASGKPWRNMTCNFLDIGLVSGMLILLDMGSLSVQERQTQTTTAIATVSFSLMTSAALFASAFGIIRYFWMKFKKPFNFFLCHHKVATGSYARLLKMELDKYGYRSFIDCDDLQDLSRLFGYVSHGTGTMVIFGSRDVFTRKWCLGEIVTARIHEVQTVLLSFPGFTAPDKDFIASLTKTFPEVLDLVSHRMGVKEIEDTLVWIPSLEAINVDRQVPRVLGETLPENYPHSKEELKIQQSREIAEAVSLGSLVGISASDDGLSRFWDEWQRHRPIGYGLERGGLVNSTCVIGYAQTGYGIAQTGSLRTSQQDGAAWRTDNTLRAQFEPQFPCNCS
ncbi:RPS6 [Symbiodinium sp. CCMP2592]|nr:RPS6 [Symbiodinium sp. CCMP2592]